MDFYGIVRQVLELLQRDGRTSYRALKRQFDLDDEALEDLKEELLFAHPVVDADGRGLIWTGDPAASEPGLQRGTEAESRFHALLRTVMALLQRERRVTYRELKYIFGLDEVLLEEMRKELLLKHVAIDEDSAVLVWTGETQHTPDTAVVTSPHDELAVITEPARTAPEAERRQLTVMFCDLAESTKLSGGLDPEELREVIRAYQATAAEVIQQYEGHIAQYLGDGLLVYFGWPQAHEDDAQRALHGGLGIVDTITNSLNPRLQQEKGVQLTVRLGVHTGPVVVGEMGGGGRHENLATGETVNIASRLEGLAAPNTEVISNITARLVQGTFELEELGPHELKGLIEPMPLFRVLSPTEIHHDEDESMPDGGAFLIGRDEEMGLLMRRWEQVKEGLGQAVLISGEAGIGKSSLVATVRNHAVEEGYTRMAFRCSPCHTNSALYPIIAHLEQMLAFDRDESSDAKLDKLEQALGRTTLSLHDAVPWLAMLLSLPLGDQYAVPAMSPQQHRQQTFDTLTGWLLEEAERQPVLAVWEDLHWADPSTLELLGLMVDQSPTAAIFNVLTFRPEFESPWSTRSHMTPMTLNRLERPQVKALITHLAGGKGLPTEVVEHIVTKTDGVPLYVEELTKMLLASELLKEEADQYVLTGPLNTVSIPATLQGSLTARLDQMKTAKEVAQLGAVLGREFDYELIQAISSQDNETLQDGLTQLVEAELLYQRGRPPRARYIFKHALIQDTAYASLLRSTRQQVHHQIGQLLEARFPEVVETQPELVAHHYTEAGQDENAVPYWHRAGQRAIQRSAHAEAIAHLTQGLALLTTRPETSERLQQELDLQVALGTALSATKGYAASDVERVYTRARELCQQIGDTTQLFPVMRGLIHYYLMRGQLQTAHQLGEELLRLAQSRNDPALLLLAHYQLGTVLFFRGELVSAQTRHTQALALYTPREHQALALRYGLDLGVVSRGFLAWELWQLGYPDQSMEHIQEARTLAQEVSHPHSLALALVHATLLHQFRREVPAVHEQAAAATTLATEQGFALWVALGTVLHGWARAILGEGEAGMAEMRQGLAAYLTTGDTVWQSYFLGLLAEAYGEDGLPEAGLQALAEALDVMDTTEVRCYAAELSRLKGALLLRQAASDVAQAETCFHQALDIARHQQAKSWELRAATRLARLWQSQGKRREAHDLLAPVYEWFTEGFDTADLQEAKVLLNELV